MFLRKKCQIDPLCTRPKQEPIHYEFDPLIGFFFFIYDFKIHFIVKCKTLTMFYLTSACTLDFEIVKNVKTRNWPEYHISGCRPIEPL